MADSRMSEFTAVDAVTGTNQIPCVQSSANKKLTVEQLQTYLFGTDVVTIGGSSNYAQVATDGTITLVGTATAFDDLLIEMKESLKGSGTKPDWDATNLGFLFPQNNVTEIIYLNVQLPHRWKEGSTIYPHIHFFQDQNVTPTFKLDYRWVNIGDSVPSFTTGYTMNSIVGA